MGISPTFVEPGMGVWPWDATDAKELVSVRWEAGVPTAINGEAVDVETAFEMANAIAGRHGVGIGTHVVENRFVGVKSRGIYESPAMELLGRSYEYLLQFVLDRRARGALRASVEGQLASRYIRDTGWTWQPRRRLARLIRSRGWRPAR